MTDPTTQGEDLHGEAWGLGQCDELALSIYTESPILELDHERAEVFATALLGEIETLRQRSLPAPTPREGDAEVIVHYDEVDKAVESVSGPPALYVPGALAAALNRSQWSRLLGKWANPAGVRLLKAGLATTGVQRPRAYDPDEIVELANKLKADPSPFAVGALLGAVLDVSATIEGERLP